MFAALLHENGYIMILIIGAFLVLVALILSCVFVCVMIQTLSSKEFGSNLFLNNNTVNTVKLKFLNSIQIPIQTLIQVCQYIAIILILNIAPDMHIGGDTYLGWDKLPIFEYANIILSGLLAAQLLVPVVKLVYQRFGYEIIMPDFFNVWRTKND